jgi:serine/threonine protein kinase
MAKELQKEDFNKADGCYRNMSRMTGTLRYMAPEVWLGQPYNAACDVYSFAIMLWEIMALQLPLAKFKGSDEFVKKVVEGGARPCSKKKESWPKTITNIMQKSWSSNWQERYTMAEISDLLRHELVVGLRGGDDDGIDHQRRRSTFVFCREAIQESLRDLDLSSELMDLGPLRASLMRSSGSRSMGRAILASVGGSDRTCGHTSIGNSSSATRTSGSSSARSSGYSTRSSGSHNPNGRLSGASHQHHQQQQRRSGSSSSSSSSPHHLPGEPRRSRQSESPLHQIPEKIENDQSSTTS